MTYTSPVILSDVGRVFTAKAAGGITGGYLVSWNSGTDNVGSGESTYSWNNIAVVENTDTTSENCIGMALTNAASGSDVSVMMQGIVILPAGSNGVSGGQVVIPVGYGGACVEKIVTGSVAATLYPIGRALTKASAAGQFAIVRLDI